MRDALTELLKNPTPLLLIFVVYIILLFWMMNRRTGLDWLFRLTRKRLLLTEAKERIARYLGDGMPEEIILDRLLYQGVPREWAVGQIARIRAQQTKPRETRPNPPDAAT